MSNWNKRIRAAREAQKMTREMVVQKMQQFLPESEKAVSTRSLMSWEAGEREPRVIVGVALAKALGFEDVAVLYLDSEPKLNQAGQQRLGEYRSMLLHTAAFTEKPEPTLRLLPVYLQPASAGTGQWLDDDAQEMTEVDESVPAKAEFGVRIAGDSMEPRFVNGQTVWVKAAQDANNGDIVLCTLNDQGYCKKLRKDENGIALISLNKKYAPIPVREEDEFRIAGIVVG
ncbi:MAG: LexA family transcriptional regulator [Gemmiger sp.]|uniref:LexA family transcriptional regulator n=1 Tax=Gemmiger sp. TaxID=2049027 RepID=UPI002E788B43|nr:LexA family transcriptional regulator [Gemmiger sp.]MEE1423889.1 LexA family transcriptional regulator [Gemmiger sp.]